MRIFSYIGLFIVFAVGLAFALLNANSVTLDLYIKQFHLALSLLLILALILGLIIGALIMLKPIMRLKAEISKLKAALNKHDLRLKQNSVLATKDS